MKISTKNLDEFRELNEEFQKLKTKDFDGGSLGCFLLILGHFFIGLLIALVSKYLGYKEFFKIWLVYVVAIPYSVLFSSLVFFFFDWIFGIESNYPKVYRHFSHKSTKYLRFKELEAYLPTIKLKIRKQLSDYCETDLEYLIQQLRATSRNKQIHEGLLLTLGDNDKFVREVFNDDGQLKNDYVKKYEYILRKNDIWFDYQLEEIKREDRIEQTIKSFRNSETTRKSPSTSYNPLGLSNTPNIQNKPIDKNQEKPIERSNQTERNPTTKENIDETKSKPILADIPKTTISNVSKPTIANISKQRELEFERETGNLIKTDILPPRRKRLTRPKVIKASPEFWANLQNKRMEIGKRGELLVMEYERKRIMREEGREFLFHLRHSSVTEGDGLGYDLTSCFEREKIFIEVKMTTGKFDSNLFFTKNEIDTMRKIEKQYFLYRVFDFDKKTKEGKLQVFKGREEIESFFDFTPLTFSLKRKN